MQKAEEKGPSKDDTAKDKDRKRKREYVKVNLTEREYVKVNLTHIQFECIFIIPLLPEGGGGYTVLPLSVSPRYFSSHFSQ